MRTLRLSMEEACSRARINNTVCEWLKDELATLQFRDSPDGQGNGAVLTTSPILSNEDAITLRECAVTVKNGRKYINR
jgi:hypothetical protein